MRIVHIIHGMSNASAGSTYYVARLTEELRRKGENSSILTLGMPPVEWPYEAPLVMHSRALARRAGISYSLMRDIRSEGQGPGVLHGHGVWRLTNLFPLILRRSSPCKIVFSAHGTLTPWSLSRKAMVKALFWRLLQKPALERTHCYHVTAGSEYDDIRRMGLRGPVAVIPCGVEAPQSDPQTPRRKRLLFLSRIDPKKGLDLLIPAWHAVAAHFSDWELIVAGPRDGDHARSMERLVASLGAPRVHFAGQVLGDAKHKLLQSASLFVLPSYSENFGIAVAEALAHGTPVITTTETPWQDIVTNRCGWLVAPNREHLEQALREAMGSPPESLRTMGARGQEWVRRRFSWCRTTTMMRQTYRWLQYGGDKPDWIISD